jgi:hypothetical protein
MNMLEWDISVFYSKKNRIIKCKVEYASTQLIRIRVAGDKNGLLLENNYPMLKFANSKKGVQWKIKEGTVDYHKDTSTQLLTDIFSSLEYLMKRDFKLLYPDYIG